MENHRFSDYSQVEVAAQDRNAYADPPEINQEIYQSPACIYMQSERGLSIAGMYYTRTDLMHLVLQVLCHRNVRPVRAP